MVDQVVLARQLCGKLSTEDKKQKLLAVYAEELECKLAKCGRFEVFGCGGRI